MTLPTARTPRTLSTPRPARQQVVVLGAGYAGTMAALRLAPAHHVTLVDPGNGFTERVRQHELAAGTRPSITHPLSRFLRGTGVQHVAARATAIDPAARSVTTDDGRTLPYDRLVHALGSRTAPTGTPRPYTAENAEALRNHLDETTRTRARTGTTPTLAVVGGGLTGIEMAAELAESYPTHRVRLLTGEQLAPGLSPRGRTHVRTTLETLGVRVEEDHHVDDPDTLDADTVVWAGAMTANTELAAAAGLALDGTGRIRVDAALRSVSHPGIYAAGDSAAGLRMSCAMALPMGVRVAESVNAEARGQEPAPLKFRYVIQCVSLGRRDGLIQFVRADDSPRDRVLTGRAAARVKEQIVRSTVHSLRLASRHPALVRRLPGLG